MTPPPATPEALYETLRKYQEPKGYFFNPDKQMVLCLLESLLTNKARYGYMACPCRLAAGDATLDKDIICPCEYRTPDVAEFGSCYCGLYVKEGYLPQDCPGGGTVCVPERRPPEKACAALGI